MTTILHPIPPSLERYREEHGRQFILVRVKVPLFARAFTWVYGRRGFYPGGNRVGVVLLARLLERTLESEGHSCLPVETWVGTLNDCDIILPVQEIYPPFETARDEIRKLNLEAVTKFGFYDFSTARWRQLWPDPDGPFEPMRVKI
jgi:hypothetical protein